VHKSFKLQELKFSSSSFSSSSFFFNTNVVRENSFVAGVYSEAIKSLLNHILYPGSKGGKELEKHPLPGINVVMKAFSRLLIHSLASSLFSFSS